MKLLIIGCGSIGQRHIRNTSDKCIVGVFDSDLVKTNKLKYEFRDLTVFDDFQESLAWKPQAILIATPPETHIPISFAVIDHCRYLLIEKPVSHSMANVHELLNLAKAKSVQVGVVSNMRFHPAINLLKKNLTKLGKPLFSRAYFGNYLPNMRPEADYRSLYVAKAQSGGIVLDCIHEIDYLQWFFGKASVETLVQGKLSELDIEGNDYATLNLRHVTNVRSELHLDYLQVVKRRGCELIGDKGILIWESVGKIPEHCSVRFYDLSSMQWSVLYEEPKVDVNYPYQQMMREFIIAVTNRVDLSMTKISTLEDGISALSTSLSKMPNNCMVQGVFNEI